jgi:hypothetical protein
MKYVYILESLDSEHFYVGITEDLRVRLAKHNAGEVSHFEIWTLAAEDLHRIQRRKVRPSIRKISQVGLRQGICEEAFLSLRTG